MLEEMFLQSLKGEIADLFHLKDEAVISFHMDRFPLQESFRFRAKQLGLRAAYLVVDDLGEPNMDRAGRLLALLEKSPFILGPGREGDFMLYGHLRSCLSTLIQSKEILMILRKFSPPLCHKRAEELVRETLSPEQIRSVQTVHVRRAVLAAWFTLLRQTTGSCFATAPAILIQRGNPVRFFKDMYDLLSIGQMKRTVAGKEYAVPLSFSAPKGDLLKVTPFVGEAPGVRAALGAVGVELKGQKIGLESVETVFRTILLDHVGLTEEDLADEEHLSRIQMSPLVARQTGIYYAPMSERGKKVAEWKKKFAKACLTFQTFTECSLLRAWEYTIASFCDVKTEFARWNLYIGLGMHPDHKGGVGAFLYEQISERLQKCNGEINSLNSEYEREVGAMQAIDAMIAGGVSGARVSQLKSELAAHHMTANAILEMRNQSIAKAEGLSQFFTSLLEQYDQKLQEYFQELFDPAIYSEKAIFFDDSAAGFRLFYKHGRLDASQWTSIHSGEQYVDCLREFFSAVENDLVVPEAIGKETISEITTALIQFTRKSEFLDAALKRSEEIGRRSPWDYVSGGTLQTLLMAYCNRDRPFTETKIVPHSVEELFHFLKGIVRIEPQLIHSPTHAFVLYPELLTKELTSRPAQKWDERMQEHLAHLVSEKLPDQERALFVHLYRQKRAAGTNAQFRSDLIECIRVKNGEALVDSCLFESAPIYTRDQAQAFVAAFGEKGEGLEGTFFGPFDIYRFVKMLILKKQGVAFSQIDWEQKIVNAMEGYGCGFSPSTLFADTNWAGWFLGFVINPATGHLELWRLNRNRTQGFPMTDWKEWLSRKNSAPWVVLSEPLEYASE